MVSEHLVLTGHGEDMHERSSGAKPVQPGLPSEVVGEDLEKEDGRDGVAELRSARWVVRPGVVQD